MLVRRHDLVGVVEPVGRVHRVTVARLGARPGLTRTSERRSESSIVINSTALVQNWFDVLLAAPQERHRARVAISCLISSLATSADVAQNGNMFFAAMSE
jgi:hypothetical protein